MNVGILDGDVAVAQVAVGGQQLGGGARVAAAQRRAAAAVGEAAGAGVAGLGRAGRRQVRGVEVQVAEAWRESTMTSVTKTAS